MKKHLDMNSMYKLRALQEVHSEQERNNLSLGQSEGRGGAGQAPCGSVCGWWGQIVQRSVNFFCQDPDGKIFVGHMIIVPTARWCCYAMKAAIDNLYPNECGWVPIKLYLWALKSELHITSSVFGGKRGSSANPKNWQKVLRDHQVGVGGEGCGCRSFSHGQLGSICPWRVGRREIGWKELEKRTRSGIAGRLEPLLKLL